MLMAAKTNPFIMSPETALRIDNDRLRGVLRKIAGRRPAWGDKMHTAFRLSREEARNALKFPKK